MSEIRRVDPRRPIVITPQGLRRIVLGQVGGEKLSHSRFGRRASRQGKAAAPPRGCESW